MKTKTSWLSSAVIYQVNLRSLAAREPRNAVEALTEKPQPLSPLAYLTKSLPRLRRLGFNVVYLLPPYPIGLLGRKGIGSPYASRDFRAVEPEYGTMEDIQAFIRRAHELKLKVIFDITPNHTARDHVWMTAHPEYYVKAPDGSAFFDADWSDTAKLDYTNHDLRAAMIEVYDFWLPASARMSTARRMAWTASASTWRTSSMTSRSGTKRCPRCARGTLPATCFSWPNATASRTTSIFSPAAWMRPMTTISTSCASMPTPWMKPATRACVLPRMPSTTTISIPSSTSGRMAA